MKHLIFFTLTAITTSCTFSNTSTDRAHAYKKYWEKYTPQQLKDSLFADTLNIGPDSYGGFNDNVFCVNTTNELLADLADDNHSVDSLYPMTSFDLVIIQPLPFGLSKKLTTKQTARLLAIINNPVSFNWLETTYESEYQIVFLKNKKHVASLTIGSDQSVIQPKPSWPDYKKMKFGALKPHSRNKLVKLMNELVN